MLLNSSEHQLRFYSDLTIASRSIPKIKSASKAIFIKKNLDCEEIGKPLTLEEKLLLHAAMK